MIKNTYTTTIKEKNSKSKYPKSKQEKKVKKGKVPNSLEEFFYSDKW